MKSGHRLFRISLVFAVLLVGCSANGTNRSFYFSSTGIVRSHPPDAEIQEARRTLLNWSESTPIPSEMKGGVMFDGTVVSVTTNNDGDRTASFEVKKIFLDASTPLGSKVNVITASEDKGGVVFEPEKVYRVYAVQLEGHYQTWTATGTVEVSAH